jgi:hypothetical protein
LHPCQTPLHLRRISIAPAARRIQWLPLNGIPRQALTAE